MAGYTKGNCWSTKSEFPASEKVPQLLEPGQALSNMSKEKLLENRTPIIDYIGKFDWNGNPVKAYQVTGNLRTYGFDPAGNRIYGIALNADSMEPELVTASIN